MIIDGHTHWGDCHQNRSGLEPTEWLSVWTRHGVTRGVVLPIEGLPTPPNRQDNDNIAAVSIAPRAE